MALSPTRLLLASACFTALAFGTAHADQVILDDLIVDGSACIGFDCVNGESFGFDTIRIKENNLRIKAQDTSSSASFPSNDWQITFNETSNGGANKFSIDDIDGGRTPFTIEAGAPSHSLYVDDGGRIGLGTSTPTVEVHVKDGDSPTLRLEQDGSSGFSTQTWDLAGNETNFFVRDVSNGSLLPFRIIPSAPTNSLYVAADGDIGMGTANPSNQLHIQRSSGNVGIFLESLASNDQVRLSLNEGSDEFRIVFPQGGGQVFDLTDTGDLTITGGLVTGTAGSCNVGTPCDAVFDPEVYTIPSIEDHAAQMWANKHLPAVGPTLPGQPVDMTKKVLTMLNELEHAHIYIEQLHTRLSALEALSEEPSIVQ